MTTVTADAALVEDAVVLAHRWLEAGAAGRTTAEARTTGRLAALLSDPAGLDLALRFVDRVARPEDPRVAAAELARLSTAGARSFLGPVDRALLGTGRVVAPLAPHVVVPAARARLRALVEHLVADAGPGLGR